MDTGSEEDCRGHDRLSIIESQRRKYDIEGAPVVLDHAGEEEVVESGSFGGGKGDHWFGGEQTGHEVEGCW